MQRAFGWMAWGASWAALAVAACASDGDGTLSPDAGDAVSAPPGAPGNACPAGLASEPPCNPALVDSPWGASHRGSYAQGSSPHEGPRADEALDGTHVYATGVPITFAFSDVYPDGGRVVWAAPLSTAAAVVKWDEATLEVLDEYLPAEREEDPPEAVLGVSGAYTLADSDGRFLVARARSLEVYEDEVPGDRASRIRLVTRFALPDSALCGEDDVVVGITMTYDGHVALATERGVVLTVPRDPGALSAASVRALHLNDEAACGDADAELEAVSNSIAADEDGGIYVVTSGAMYRVDWDGSSLSLGWRAEYEAGDRLGGVRLGAGSGSTPSLMGTGADEDRFVVLTDGQELMHLVLMWRDAIPDGWEPVAPGRDPRIACEVPITFGDPAATVSLSEQSVLVRGHSAVVVNNLLKTPDAFDGGIPFLASALSALEGGNPDEAPYGIERVDWDPESRSCRVAWSNPALSIPNGIPTMSERTGLVYGAGQQGGVWGLEAVDFATGERAFFEPAPDQSCDALLDRLPPVERFAVEATLERLPRSCENSAYAATQVGPDGSLYQGTFYGLTRYRPAPSE